MRTYKNSILKRFTALLICFSMGVTGLTGPAPQTAHAAPSAALGISLPENLGTLEEFHFQPNSSKTVVYIQDAHDSLEAQENIAGIIRHLTEEQGVRTVLEEGYEGEVPTGKYFGKILEKETREKISYFLMDQLRIGGAEYAHINRKADFKLIGADSLKLQRENIRWYQNAAANRQEIEADLREMETRLLNLMKKNFPQKLQSWVRLRKQHDAGQLDLLRYLQRTVSLKPATVLLQDYPVLRLFFETEQTKNAARIHELGKIRGSEVFSEVEKWEQAIAEGYLTQERDRRIFRFYQTLQLLKRLNEVKVTSTEFAALRQEIHSFDTARLAELVVSETQKPLVLSKRWEKNIESAIGFYETAGKRDEVVEKTLQGQDGTTVLVYGGFHKERIKEIFKRQGISYLIVSPKMTQVSEAHAERYRKLMELGTDRWKISESLNRAARAFSDFFMAAEEPEALQKEIVLLNRISQSLTPGLSREEMLRAMDLAWTQRARFEMREQDKLDDDEIVKASSPELQKALGAVRRGIVTHDTPHPAAYAVIPQNLSFHQKAHRHYQHFGHLLKQALQTGKLSTTLFTSLDEILKKIAGIYEAEGDKRHARSAEILRENLKEVIKIVTEHYPDFSQPEVESAETYKLQRRDETTRLTPVEIPVVESSKKRKAGEVHFATAFDYWVFQAAPYWNWLREKIFNRVNVTMGLVLGVGALVYHAYNVWMETLAPDNEFELAFTRGAFGLALFVGASFLAVVVWAFRINSGMAGPSRETAGPNPVKKLTPKQLAEKEERRPMEGPKGDDDDDEDDFKLNLNPPRQEMRQAEGFNDEFSPIYFKDLPNGVEIEADYERNDDESSATRLFLRVLLVDALQKEVVDWAKERDAWDIYAIASQLLAGTRGAFRGEHLNPFREFIFNGLRAIEETRSGKGTLRLRIQKTGELIHFEFLDNGRGISREAWKTIGLEEGKSHRLPNDPYGHGNGVYHSLRNFFRDFKGSRIEVWSGQRGYTYFMADGGNAARFPNKNTRNADRDQGFRTGFKLIFPSTNTLKQSSDSSLSVRAEMRAFTEANVSNLKPELQRAARMTGLNGKPPANMVFVAQPNKFNVNLEGAGPQNFHSFWVTYEGRQLYVLIPDLRPDQPAFSFEWNQYDIEKEVRRLPGYTELEKNLSLARQIRNHWSRVEETAAALEVAAAIPSWKTLLQELEVFLGDPQSLLIKARSQIPASFDIETVLQELSSWERKRYQLQELSQQAKSIKAPERIFDAETLSEVLKVYETAKDEIPGLRQNLELLRTWIRGGEKIHQTTLENYLNEMQWAFQETYQMETAKILPPQVSQQVLYDLKQILLARDTQRLASEIEALAPENTSHYALQIFNLAEQIQNLTIEKFFTGDIAENFSKGFHSQKPDVLPVIASGILYLGREKSRWVPGAGAEEGRGIFTPHFPVPHVLQHSEGEDAVVFVYNSETGFPSLNTVKGFLRDRNHFQSTALDGKPVALGTLDAQGNLRIYSPRIESLPGQIAPASHKALELEAFYPFNEAVYDQVLKRAPTTKISKEQILTTDFARNRLKAHEWSERLGKVIQRRAGDQAPQVLTAFTQRWNSQIQFFKELKFRDPGDKVAANQRILAASRGNTGEIRAGRARYNQEVAAINHDMEVMEQKFVPVIERATFYASELMAGLWMQDWFEFVPVEGLTAAESQVLKIQETAKAEETAQAELPDEEVESLLAERLTQMQNHFRQQRQEWPDEEQEAFKAFFRQWAPQFWKEHKNKKPNFPQTRDAWRDHLKAAANRVAEEERILREEYERYVAARKPIVDYLWKRTVEGKHLTLGTDELAFRLYALEWITDAMLEAYQANPKNLPRFIDFKRDREAFLEAQDPDFVSEQKIQEFEKRLKAENLELTVLLEILREIMDFFTTQQEVSENHWERLETASIQAAAAWLEKFHRKVKAEAAQGWISQESENHYQLIRKFLMEEAKAVGQAPAPQKHLEAIRLLIESQQKELDLLSQLKVEAFAVTAASLEEVKALLKETDSYRSSAHQAAVDISAARLQLTLDYVEKVTDESLEIQKGEEPAQILKLQTIVSQLSPYFEPAEAARIFEPLTMAEETIKEVIRAAKAVADQATRIENQRLLDEERAGRASKDAALQAWLKNPEPEAEAAKVFLAEPQFQEFLNENRVVKQFLESVKAGNPDKLEKVKKFIEGPGRKAIGPLRNLLDAVSKIEKSLSLRNELRFAETQAFLQAIKVLGEPVFSEAATRELSEKFSKLPLQAGQTALVLGPGSTDYLPTLLAKAGLRVTTYDPKEHQRYLQGLIQEEHEVAEQILSLESEETLNGKKFDHVFVLAVVNPVINSAYLRSQIVGFPREEIDSVLEVSRFQGARVLQSAFSSLSDNGYLYINDFAADQPLQLDIPRQISQLNSIHRSNLTLQPQFNIDDFTLSMAHSGEKRKGFVFKAQAPFIAPLFSRAGNVRQEERHRVIKPTSAVFREKIKRPWASDHKQLIHDALVRRNPKAIAKLFEIAGPETPGLQARLNKRGAMTLFWDRSGAKPREVSLNLFEYPKALIYLRFVKDAEGFPWLRAFRAPVDFMIAERYYDTDLYEMVSGRAHFRQRLVRGAGEVPEMEYSIPITRQNNNSARNYFAFKYLGKTYNLQRPLSSRYEGIGTEADLETIHVLVRNYYGEDYVFGFLDGDENDPNYAFAKWRLSWNAKEERGKIESVFFEVPGHNIWFHNLLKGKRSTRQLYFLHLPLDAQGAALIHKNLNLRIGDLYKNSSRQMPAEILMVNAPEETRRVDLYEPKPGDAQELRGPFDPRGRRFITSKYYYKKSGLLERPWQEMTRRYRKWQDGTKETPAPIIMRTLVGTAQRLGAHPTRIMTDPRNQPVHFQSLRVEGDLLLFRFVEVSHNGKMRRAIEGISLDENFEPESVAKWGYYDKETLQFVWFSPNHRKPLGVKRKEEIQKEIKALGYYAPYLNEQSAQLQSRMQALLQKIQITILTPQAAESILEDYVALLDILDDFWDFTRHHSIEIPELDETYQELRQALKPFIETQRGEAVDIPVLVPEGSEIVFHDRIGTVAGYDTLEGKIMTISIRFDDQRHRDPEDQIEIYKYVDIFNDITVLPPKPVKRVRKKKKPVETASNGQAGTESHPLVAAPAAVPSQNGEAQITPPVESKTETETARQEARPASQEYWIETQALDPADISPQLGYFRELRRSAYWPYVNGALLKLFKKSQEDEFPQDFRAILLYLASGDDIDYSKWKKGGEISFRYEGKWIRQHIRMAVSEPMAQAMSWALKDMAFGEIDKMDLNQFTHYVLVQASLFINPEFLREAYGERAPQVLKQTEKVFTRSFFKEIDQALSRKRSRKMINAPSRQEMRDQGKSSRPWWQSVTGFFTGWSSKPAPITDSKITEVPAQEIDAREARRIQLVDALALFQKELARKEPLIRTLLQRTETAIQIREYLLVFENEVQNVLRQFQSLYALKEEEQTAFAAYGRSLVEKLQADFRERLQTLSPVVQVETVQTPEAVEIQPAEPAPSAKAEPEEEEISLIELLRRVVQALKDEDQQRKRQAVETNRLLRDVRTDLGEARRLIKKERRDREAAAIYRKIMDNTEVPMDYRSQAAVGLAKALANFGQDKEALEVLDKMIEKDPYNKFLEGRRALTLSFMHRHVEAIRQAEELIARDFRNTAAWNVRLNSSFSAHLSKQHIETLLREAREEVLPGISDPEEHQLLQNTIRDVEQKLKQRRHEARPLPEDPDETPELAEPETVPVQEIANQSATSGWWGFVTALWQRILRRNRFSQDRRFFFGRAIGLGFLQGQKAISNLASEESEVPRRLLNLLLDWPGTKFSFDAMEGRTGKHLRELRQRYLQLQKEGKITPLDQQRISGAEAGFAAAYKEMKNSKDYLISETEFELYDIAMADAPDEEYERWQTVAQWRESEVGSWMGLRGDYIDIYEKAKTLDLKGEKLFDFIMRWKIEPRVVSDFNQLNPQAQEIGVKLTKDEMLRDVRERVAFALKHSHDPRGYPVLDSKLTRQGLHGITRKVFNDYAEVIWKKLKGKILGEVSQKYGADADVQNIERTQEDRDWIPDDRNNEKVQNPSTFAEAAKQRAMQQSALQRFLRKLEEVWPQDAKTPFDLVNERTDLPFLSEDELNQLDPVEYAANRNIYLAESAVKTAQKVRTKRVEKKRRQELKLNLPVAEPIFENLVKDLERAAALSDVTFVIHLNRKGAFHRVFWETKFGVQRVLTADERKPLQYLWDWELRERYKGQRYNIHIQQGVKAPWIEQFLRDKAWWFQAENKKSDIEIYLNRPLALEGPKTPESPRNEMRFFRAQTNAAAKPRYNLSHLMHHLRPIALRPLITEMKNFPAATLEYPPFEESQRLGEAGENSGGTFYNQILRNGEKHIAVVKKFKEQTAQALKREELVKLQVMGMLGVGPEFYGVIRNTQGNIEGYVMQMAEGRKVPMAAIYGGEALPRENIYEYADMREIRRRLNLVGLDHVTDYVRTKENRFIALDAGLGYYEPHFGNEAPFFDSSFAAGDDAFAAFAEHLAKGNFDFLKERLAPRHEVHENDEGGSEMEPVETLEKAPEPISADHYWDLIKSTNSQLKLKVAMEDLSVRTMIKGEHFLTLERIYLNPTREKLFEVPRMVDPALKRAAVRDMVFSQREEGVTPSLESSLLAFKQNVRQLINRVVLKKRSSAYIGQKELMLFISKVWDLEEDEIHGDIKKALLLDAEHYFVTHDFGTPDRRKTRSFHGRLNEKQIEHMMGFVQEGIDEIELVVRGLAPELVEKTVTSVKDPGRVTMILKLLHYDGRIQAKAERTQKAEKAVIRAATQKQNARIQTFLPRTRDRIAQLAKFGARVSKSDLKDEIMNTRQALILDPSDANLARAEAVLNRAIQEAGITVTFLKEMQKRYPKEPIFQQVQPLPKQVKKKKEEVLTREDQDYFLQVAAVLGVEKKWTNRLITLTGLSASVPRLKRLVKFGYLESKVEDLEPKVGRYYTVSYQVTDLGRKLMAEGISQRLEVRDPQEPAVLTVELSAGFPVADQIRHLNVEEGSSVLRLIPKTLEQRRELEGLGFSNSLDRQPFIQALEKAFASGQVERIEPDEEKRIVTVIFKTGVDLKLGEPLRKIQLHVRRDEGFNQFSEALEDFFYGPPRIWTSKKHLHLLAQILSESIPWMMEIEQPYVLMDESRRLNAVQKLEDAKILQQVISEDEAQQVRTQIAAAKRAKDSLAFAERMKKRDDEARAIRELKEVEDARLGAERELAARKEYKHTIVSLGVLTDLQSINQLMFEDLALESGPKNNALDRKVVRLNKFQPFLVAAIDRETYLQNDLFAPVTHWAADFPSMEELKEANQKAFNKFTMPAFERLLQKNQSQVSPIRYQLLKQRVAYGQSENPEDEGKTLYTLIPLGPQQAAVVYADEEAKLVKPYWNEEGTALIYELHFDTESFRKKEVDVMDIITAYKLIQRFNRTEKFEVADLVGFDDFFDALKPTFLLNHFRYTVFSDRIDIFDAQQRKISSIRDAEILARLKLWTTVRIFERYLRRHFKKMYQDGGSGESKKPARERKFKTQPKQKTLQEMKFQNLPQKGSPYSTFLFHKNFIESKGKVRIFQKEILPGEGFQTRYQYAKGKVPKSPTERIFSQMNESLARLAFTAAMEVSQGRPGVVGDAAYTTEEIFQNLEKLHRAVPRAEARSLAEFKELLADPDTARQTTSFGEYREILQEFSGGSSVFEAHLNRLQFSDETLAVAWAYHRIGDARPVHLGRMAHYVVRALGQLMNPSEIYVYSERVLEQLQRLNEVYPKPVFHPRFVLDEKDWRIVDPLNQFFWTTDSYEELIAKIEQTTRVDELHSTEDEIRWRLRFKMGFGPEDWFIVRAYQQNNLDLNKVLEVLFENEFILEALDRRGLDLDIPYIQTRSENMNGILVSSSTQGKQTQFRSLSESDGKQFELLFDKRAMREMQDAQDLQHLGKVIESIRRLASAHLIQGAKGKLLEHDLRGIHSVGFSDSQSSSNKRGRLRLLYKIYPDKQEAIILGFVPRDELEDPKSPDYQRLLMLNELSRKDLEPYLLDVNKTRVILEREFGVDRSAAAPPRQETRAIEKMAAPIGVFVNAEEAARLLQPQWEELLVFLARHPNFDLYIDGNRAEDFPGILQALAGEFSNRIHFGARDQAGLHKKQILVQLSLAKELTAAKVEESLRELKDRYEISSEIYPLAYTQAGALTAFLDLVESKGMTLREQAGDVYASFVNGRWRMTEDYLRSIWTSIQTSYIIKLSA